MHGAVEHSFEALRDANCAPKLLIKVKCMNMAVSTCVQSPALGPSGCCAPGPGSCSPAAASASPPPSLSASPPSAGRPAPTDTPPSPAPAWTPQAGPGLAASPATQPPRWPRATLPPAPAPGAERSLSCDPVGPAQT